MRKKILRSSSGFENPESREEAIMQNILGASNVLEPSESNIEEILKSILYNTPYTKEAEFEIEKILLAIKNNGTYDGEGESRDMKILIAILKDLDYTEEAESRIEELFIEWHHQRSPIKALEGVPPLTFTSRGLPLINYLIEGNTVQSGTPTPDNPIYPSECGERTGNLFEYPLNNYSTTINGVEWEIENATITGVGFTTSAGFQDCIIVSKTGLTRYGNYPAYLTISSTRDLKLPAGTYTFSYVPITEPTAKSDRPRLIVGHNGTRLSDDTAVAVYNGETFTCDGDDYVVLVINTQSEIGEYEFKNFMLNIGSAPLPYEPYGYKIPILCGNQTINIYLGETQSTRQIKKLVLTGEEAIEIKSGNAKWYIPIADMKIPTNPSVIDWYCSHYQAVANVDTWTSYDYMISWSSADSDSLIGLRIRDINFLTGVTVDDFKSYLAAQYAAGTPVTVWYVLATEETGIVNEPLMKIGEYADTLSMEQAGAQIPTVNGSNTLDVDTTVKPSNVYIEYK